MNLALNVGNEITDIPVDKILPNPYQPRRTYERKALNELAKSIRQYGVIQPICVRSVKNGYEIISGERRLKASKLAGMQFIPAVILKISDRDCAVLSLGENIHRKDLNYIEEADAINTLMKDFNLTQEDIAHLLSRGRGEIALKLRLLRLSPAVRQMLIKNNIGEAYARALLRLSRADAQQNVLEQVIKYGLSLKKTNELIDNAIKNNGEIGIIRKSPRIKLNFRDVRMFANTIKQAVELMNISGMETDYEIKQNNNLYEIKINIKTNEKADKESNEVNGLINSYSEL